MMRVGAGGGAIGVTAASALPRNSWDAREVVEGDERALADSLDAGGGL